MPKIEQILWLFKCCPFAEGRNAARIACGSSGISGETAQMFTTTTDLLHRICPMQFGNDDYNTDLASAKEHNMFKSLIYGIIWVSRNQEGNGYMNVSSLYCLQDTQGNFWLHIWVVQKAEPA